MPAYADYYWLRGLCWLGSGLKHNEKSRGLAKIFISWLAAWLGIRSLAGRLNAGCRRASQIISSSSSNVQPIFIFI
jgi:hypothetical protein